MVDFSQKLTARRREFSGLGIVAVYLAVAGLWMVGSDHFVGWLITVPKQLTRLQTVKGWLFVLATAVLLFVLIRQRILAHWSALESYRATLELAPVGVAHVGIDGRWLRVNPALCRFLGYSHKELSKLSFHDLTFADDLEADLDHIERLLSGEIDSYQLQKRYQRKDGQTVWGDLSVTLVCDEEGRPLHFISIISDIDRSKKAEQELCESEQRYRYLFEKNPHSMLVFDIETLRFLAVNDAMVSHYG